MTPTRVYVAAVTLLAAYALGQNRAANKALAQANWAAGWFEKAWHKEIDAEEVTFPFFE